MLHIQQEAKKNKILSNEWKSFKSISRAVKFETDFTSCCRIFLLDFNETNNSHRGLPNQLRIGG